MCELRMKGMKDPRSCDKKALWKNMLEREWNKKKEISTMHAVVHKGSIGYEILGAYSVYPHKY